MRLEMLVVRDAKTEAFMTPFFAQSVGAAERMFGDVARDAKEPVGQHPEDYALFWLGTFFPLEGTLEVKPQPVQVCLAVNLLQAGGPRLA